MSGIATDVPFLFRDIEGTDQTLRKCCVEGPSVTLYKTLLNFTKHVKQYEVWDVYIKYVAHTLFLSQVPHRKFERNDAYGHIGCKGLIRYLYTCIVNMINGPQQLTSLEWRTLDSLTLRYHYMPHLPFASKYLQ